LPRRPASIIGGRLDILVANAGVSKAASIEEITVEDFDKLFAVNVRAAYFLVQQLLPVLGEGSSVILVSSLGAHAAVGTLSAYAATKGAIDTLVKYFAAALGPRGIRVNGGRTGRDRHGHVEPRQDRRGQVLVLDMQAIKRIGQPDDVGSVVAFLASQDARWINRRHHPRRWRLEALSFNESDMCAVDRREFQWDRDPSETLSFNLVSEFRAASACS